jgi:hypothetical protein
MWTTSPINFLTTTTTRDGSPHTQKSTQKEGYMDLAVRAIKRKQIKSKRKAAKSYKVLKTTLGRRLDGVEPKLGSRASNNLLLPIEEEKLIQ